LFIDEDEDDEVADELTPPFPEDDEFDPNKALNDHASAPLLLLFPSPYVN
jgi:hypothetical protein